MGGAWSCCRRDDRIEDHLLLGPIEFVNPFMDDDTDWDRSTSFTEFTFDPWDA